PYPYRVKEKTNKYTSFVFIGPHDTEYEVSIIHSKINSAKSWDDTVTDYDIAFSFGSAKFNLRKLNDGSQFRILATVKKIIFSFFDKHPLESGDVINFDTFDPATSRMYEKFARELAKRTGSTLKVIEQPRNNKGFHLEK